MKPNPSKHFELRIGVSACFFYPDPNRAVFKNKTLLYMEQSIIEFIMQHGGLPILLPITPTTIPSNLLIDQIDGLVLQGGTDIAPQSYNETPLKSAWNGDYNRDCYEIELIKQCVKNQKPILGICRGLQILNVAFGGTLFQDITTQLPTARKHRDQITYDQLSHTIDIEPTSWLHNIYKNITSACVNSVHHQAIKKLGDGLVAEAYSSNDGIIEAARLDIGFDNRLDNHSNAEPNPLVPFVYGVQWHPEFILKGQTNLLDPKPLFDHFFNAVHRRSVKIT